MKMKMKKRRWCRKSRIGNDEEKGEHEDDQDGDVDVKNKEQTNEEV
jgi:hypothetical protein